MLKPPRLTICLLVALAVVASGCGSAEKTASTNAAGTSASAPSKPSPQTASQSTSSTQAQHTTSKAPEPKTAEAKSKSEQQASKKSAEAAKPKTEAAKPKTEAAAPKLEAAAQSVPRKKQYSARTQFIWMKRCETAKGSHLDCECILVKQELAKVETGQSLAEILAIEFAMQKGISLEQVLRQGVPFPGGSQLVHAPAGIRRSINTCLSASK